MHPINTFGTDAQKQKYLPALGDHALPFGIPLKADSIRSKGRAYWMLCWLIPFFTAGAHGLPVSRD